MRRIKLDDEDVKVKQFVQGLPRDPDGSVLELEGECLLRVLPIDEGKQSVEKKKLRAAIVRRRDESRRLNEDWQEVDRDGWEHLA